MTVFRLPLFAQESPLRHPYEWTILAENRWPRDGRKLTGGASVMKMLPLFTNLIVTYNSADDIPHLLRDIQVHAPPPKSDVVVVDNASHDQTVQIIRSQFPQVSLAANTHNRGFAAAVNQGFDLCETEYVFILNPDMRIMDRAFYPAMLACLRGSPNTAAVGPLQFKPGGGNPRLNFTWSYLTPSGMIVYLSHMLRLGRRFDSPIRTTFLNAGCLLVRRSGFLKVGKLSEGYFLYGEEPDLCLKFIKHGYECKLHPGVGVIHYRERSLSTLSWPQRYLIKLRAIPNIAHALLRGFADVLETRMFGT